MPGAVGESLLGRERDLDILHRFLSATGLGTGQAAAFPGVLVVRGVPGIGKTSVLNAVGRHATSRGTRVLRATGVESELDIGFAALTQLIAPARALMPQISRPEQLVLGAVLGESDPIAGTPSLIAKAVNALLEAVADDAEAAAATDVPACPVLSVVDDLQWIDRASADVLGEVARNLNPRRCRMLVAERTGSRTYFDTTGHVHHELVGLTEQAAELLLVERFPDLSPVARSRVVTDAGGNPLALLELPTGLDPAQRTAASLPTHLPLTQRLQSMFGARIAQLPPETRQLLLLVALDEQNLPLTLLDWNERLRVLAPAERGALIQIDRATNHVEFRHPLMRATVVSTSTSQERRRAHRSLATRYDAGDERAAWHLATASVKPDEDVAALLEQAASKARHRGDATGAVRALIRAAQLSPTPSQRARRFAKAAHQGAEVEGDLAHASSLLTRARSADPGSGQTLQAAVATAYLLLNGAGDTHTAHQVLVGALEGARGGAIDLAVHAEAIQTLGEICLYAAEPVLWEAFEAALSALPLDAFPDLALWVNLMVDPVRTAHAALPALERALHGLRSEFDPAKLQRTATAAIYVDRVSTVRDHLNRLVEQARHGEGVAGGLIALVMMSLSDFHGGAWQRASVQAEEGVRLADVHGFTLTTWSLKFTQALVAAGVGDHDRVRDIVDQMLGWATPRRAGTVQNYAHRVTALDALGRGDYDAAYRSAVLICPPGELPAHKGHALWLTMDLVEAAVHAGHASAARAHVRAIKEADLASLSPRLAVLVAGSEAIAAHEVDHPLFQRALALPGVDECPFEVARIRLVYGQRLRRTRAATQARPHLAAAVDAFEELGAQPWAARARAELLATSPLRRSASNGASPALTARELRIAVLAAEGSTNKEIADQLLISPRTVGAHLHTIFTKLEITSRAALHRALGATDDLAQ